MSTLLDLAYNKDYFEFANIILKIYSNRISYIGYSVNPEVEVLNIINSCVFVVKDINKLIDNVKKIGYSNINEGPQPWRGQINSMSHFFIDYRYKL